MTLTVGHCTQNKFGIVTQSAASRFHCLTGRRTYSLAASLQTASAFGDLIFLLVDAQLHVLSSFDDNVPRLGRAHEG